MQKYKTRTISILLAIVVLFVENNTLFLGKTINRYFPCQQDPASSFPCYGIYDIYFMIAAILIIGVALTVIGVKLYKAKKAIKKQDLPPSN